MPSFRVVDATLSLSVFDTVGQDGGETGFLAHVGLAVSSGPRPAARIPVLDMGPPLHDERDEGFITAHAIGSAELTADEAQKIKTFIDRHANEHQLFKDLAGRGLLSLVPQMYCIFPHACPLLEENGRYSRMRFSCAGFALEAYKKAGVFLLEPGNLPMATLETIKCGYPCYLRFLDDASFREKLGLSGDGPWQVLFCAYLFHSLNRDAELIRRAPFTPTLDQRYFR